MTTSTSRNRPPPSEPCSSCVCQTVGAAIDTSVAPAADVEEDDYVGDYEDEVDQNQNYVQPPAPQPTGRPHSNNHNGRALPQV